MTETQELIARLQSHMGLADMQEVLADCRLAASAIEHLVAERDAAVAAEREACAQVLETGAGWIGKYHKTPGASLPTLVAAAIRARNAGSGEQL